MIATPYKYSMTSGLAFGARGLSSRRKVAGRGAKPDAALGHAQPVGEEHDRRKQEDVEQKSLPFGRDHQNAGVLDDAEDQGRDRGAGDVADPADDRRDD